jgi:tripartite-type tricarboxylate transporter receptor subunit TctC
MLLRLAMIILGAAVLLIGDATMAQEYPTKPIRFVVPNSPGVPVDSMARLLAEAMSKVLGQPIIVENKPGAAQLIGLEYVAKRVPADGYTIAVVYVGVLATLPLTVKDMPFNAMKDLLPFVSLAEGRYLFGSPTKVPWKTFAEFVASAKANPGKFNYAESSPPDRLLNEGLLRDLGVDVAHVPYNASGPFVQAVVSGDVQAAFLAESQAVSFKDRFRVLAVTGGQRSASFPDVPTFTELGFPKIRGFSYSLNAPAGTPKAVLDKLYAAAAQVLKQPDVRSGLAKIGLEIDADNSPEAAETNLVERARFYADIAEKIGLRPE